MDPAYSGDAAQDIDGDGVIFQCQYPEPISAQCYGHNQYTLGVCLLGNFQAEQPPQAQLDAAAALVEYLKSSYDLDDEDVRGHKEMEGNETACPGNTWLYWKDIILGAEYA